MTRTTNARTAGVAFLLYIAVGITQMIVARGLARGDAGVRLVSMAAHATEVRINILLTLLTAAMALTLATTLHALTRDVDRDLAAFARSCRAGEGLMAALAPLASLALLSLGSTTDSHATAPATAGILAQVLFEARTWNTTLSATLFAVGSTLFAWLMLRGRIVPAMLAGLGVIASVVLVIGLPLQLVGWLDGRTMQMLWLPMAAFEIPLALWLIVKGARAPAGCAPNA